MIKAVRKYQGSWVFNYPGVAFVHFEGLYVDVDTLATL